MKPLVIPKTAQTEFHWKEHLRWSSSAVFKSSSKAAFEREETKGILSPLNSTMAFFTSPVWHQWVCAFINNRHITYEPYAFEMKNTLEQHSLTGPCHHLPDVLLVAKYLNHEAFAGCDLLNQVVILERKKPLELMTYCSGYKAWWLQKGCRALLVLQLNEVVIFLPWNNKST